MVKPSVLDSDGFVCIVMRFIQEPLARIQRETFKAPHIDVNNRLRVGFSWEARLVSNLIKTGYEIL